MINVVCIKWGDFYPAHYVNRLYDGVRRWLHSDVRFVCFTDDADGIDNRLEVHPIPIEPFEDTIVEAMTRDRGRRGAWRKISLFRPGLAGLEGRILGFDLDVVITGWLDEIADFAPDKVVMRREWRHERFRRDGGHGSVFSFDPALHPYLYEEFAADPRGAILRHRGSEQYYTSMTALRHGALRYLPGDMVCSFKKDSVPVFPINLFREPRLPSNCRVMCFHGSPKMHEAIGGYRASWRHRTTSCRWLEESWSDC